MMPKMLPYSSSLDIQSFDNERKVVYLKPYDPMDLLRDAKIKEFQGLPYRVEKNAIANVAHRFNAGSVRIIAKDHERPVSAWLVESTLSHKDFNYDGSPYTAHEGSWIVGLKLSDDLWELAKKGQIKGISPSGGFINYYNAGDHWIVTELTCNELSLVIDRDYPINQTPILYMNAKEKQDMTEEDIKSYQEQSKKYKEDLDAITKERDQLKSDLDKTKQEPPKPPSKDDSPPPAQQSPTDPTLITALNNLNSNLIKQIELNQSQNPEYQAQMIKAERDALFETLKSSKDPLARQMLDSLQKQDKSLQKQDKSGGIQQPYSSPATGPFQSQTDPNTLMGSSDKPMPDAMRREVLDTIANYKKDITKKPRDLLIEVNRISHKHSYGV